MPDRKLSEVLSPPEPIPTYYDLKEDRRSLPLRWWIVAFALLMIVTATVCNYQTKHEGFETREMR